MGDPAGASAHVHSSLKKDGTWMIVESRSGYVLAIATSNTTRSATPASFALSGFESLFELILGLNRAQRHLKCAGQKCRAIAACLHSHSQT
jgi:hypothetical protein